MCYLKEVWTIIRSIKYRAEAGTYLKLLENFGLVYYLVRDIKPPNDQSCFLQFFNELSTVVAVETENKLFIGPKQVLFQFWINEKFVFFFNCSN